MKAQWKRLALLSATATMLAACGGGSSGNAPQNHAVPSGNNNMGNNNAGNGNAADTKITGAYFRVINDTEEVSTGNTDVHGDLNSLVIDGTKFQISAPNVQAHTFTSMSDSRYESLISGNHLSYARYGAFWDRKARIDYMFYQGHASASIPTAGIVNYEGHAVYGNEESDGWHAGHSKFTVDFGGAKSVKGTINGANIPGQIDLNATIHGNTFSGKSNGIEVDGQFYGPNAAELSGKFINEKHEFGGVFGAKKK